MYMSINPFLKGFFLATIFSQRQAIILALVIPILISCGGGGGGGGTPAPAPPTPPQDTASITADPAVVFQSNSTVISWNSANASSCTASGYWSGSKATSGSETVPMTGDGDQTLTITCGSASASVTVQVKTEDFEGSCVNPHNADIHESYLLKRYILEQF